MKLLKLVRDKIPTVTGQQVMATYSTMAADDHIMELRKKLIEEATEYLFEPSLEELADLIEVIEALVKYDLEVELTELQGAVQQKRTNKGGFHDATGLYIVTREDIERAATR